MDGFEWNKIIGAILGTLLFVTAIGFVAEVIYHPIEGRLVGYSLPGGEEHGDGEVIEVAEAEPLAVLLASASADAGARQARKCTACHSFEEGEGNKVGPALWDVVGRPVAAVGDYAYSDAFQQMGGAGTEWTYAELDAFLASPREHVPGTKMSFAGLPDETDRADLLAYLQTLSASPVAFPEPEAEAAMPAEETAEAAAHAEEPMAEEPMAEEPMAEEPMAEEPMAEEPMAEEPMAEEPMAEEPMAEEPMAEEPMQSDEASGLSALLAAASVDAGAQQARKCAACHSLEEGGPNRVGPHIWDVIGRPVAAVGDFAYSQAFQSYAASGATWTFEELDAFLVSPREHVPGTRMAFPGLPSESDRADLLVYLRTLSANPVPLP